MITLKNTNFIKNFVVKNEDYLLKKTFTATFIISDNNGFVQNASIEINETIITTDVNGAASIELSNGKYTYVVSKLGYDNIEGNILRYGENITISHEMIKTIYVLSLNLIDVDTNNTIPNVSITIGSETKETNINGVCAFQLVSGTYRYDAIKSGFIDNFGFIDIDSADVDRTIKLKSDGTGIDSLADGDIIEDGDIIKD